MKEEKKAAKPLVFVLVALGLLVLLLMVCVAIINLQRKDLLELEAKLEKAHEERMRDGIEQVIRDICVAPEVVHMDGRYRRDLEKAAEEMWKRLPEQEILENFLFRSPEYFFRNEAPLDDVSQSSRGSHRPHLMHEAEMNFANLHIVFHDCMARAEDQLEGEFAGYLLENPEVFQDYLRPLILRLIPHARSYNHFGGVKLMMAHGQHSPEFKAALVARVSNPRQVKPNCLRLFRMLDEGGYGDWAVELRAIREEHVLRWAGRTEELQADQQFSATGRGVDSNGHELPIGALARMGKISFRSSGYQPSNLIIDDEAGTVHLEKSVERKRMRICFDLKSGSPLGMAPLQNRVYYSSHDHLIDRWEGRSIHLRSSEGHSYRHKSDELVVRNHKSGEDVRIVSWGEMGNFSRLNATLAAALNNEGKLMALTYTKDDHTDLCQLYDAESGQRLISVAVERQGGMVVDGSDRIIFDEKRKAVLYGLMDGSVVALDQGTGEMLYHTEDYGRQYRTMRVSNDVVYLVGRELLIGFDLKTGDPICRLDENLIQCSPDMDLVAVMRSNRESDVYTLPDLKKVNEQAIKGRVIALRNQRAVLAADGMDSVRVVEVKGGTTVVDLQMREQPSALCLSADGETLVATRGNHATTLQVWDVASGQMRDGAPDGHLAKIVQLGCDAEGPFSLDGSTVIRWSGDGQIREKFDQVRTGSHSSEPTCISSDGRLVAEAVSSKKVEVRELSSGEPVASFVTNEKVSSLLFLDQGRILVVGYKTGLVRVWDVNDDRLLQTMPVMDEVQELSGHGESMRFVCRTSEDLHLFAIGSDKSAWRVMTAPTTGGMVCAQLGAKGEELMVAHFFDDLDKGGYVRFVDASEGVTRLEFWVRGRVCSLTLSPNQELVAIGFEDGRVQLHRVDDGQPLVVYRGHGSGAVVTAFDPGGKAIFTGGADTTILKWRLPSEEAEDER